MGAEDLHCFVPAAASLSEFARPLFGRRALAPMPADRAARFRRADAPLIDPAPRLLDGGHPGTPIWWDDLVDLLVASRG